jgi:transcriptional regulator with XRE-family HTH domain
MAQSRRSAEHVALGLAIRELRVTRELSQERFARSIHNHRNYVGAIERGEINPTFRILLDLARGFDLPLSELVARAEALRERR